MNKKGGVMGKMVLILLVALLVYAWATHPDVMNDILTGFIHLIASLIVKVKGAISP